MTLLAAATPESSPYPAAAILVVAALSLLPFFVLMLTSFVKISVVLAIFRSALGTPEIPPTLVITGIALILTAHVMTPTARAVGREVEPLLVASKGASALSGEGASLLIEAARRGAEPVRAFLLRHSHADDRALFVDLAARLAKREDAKLEPPGERDLGVLAPAFVVGELSEAFRIGFLVFLPFLVVDLVIANILLALGMTALAPNAIALPFKLLLFVMVDGWRLLAKGLILGYA
ncbi:MAG: flagellar type III secretion system pore protein FliP [Myxococcota bacterium]